MTTQGPIAHRVAEFAAETGTQMPEEIAAAFTAEQAALDAVGVPDGVLAAGAAMPDGQLLDTEGRSTTLALARGDRASVVVFYRGAWCPYCNITLRTYQEHLVPALAERGVGLIAISPQRPDGSLSMRETNELSYVVLSDPGNQIAGKLGILTAPSDGAVQAQATLGMDLADVNADGTRALPMPTVAIVDAHGVLRWIDVHANYTTRTEPADILAALATLTA